MQERLQSLLKWFRLPGIYVVLPGSWGSDRRLSNQQKSKLKIPQKPALFVDTSALIDGRIVDIKESGFLSGTFVVPTFVVEELQHIADSKDTLRRNRGRRGLDVLKELKRSEFVKFKLVKIPLNGDAVDGKLVQLAKKMNGRIITTDYNLNKVAKVSDVPILNVNELANMVKTVVLPGETLQVTILKKGKEKKQGIGYLPDGTLVVVEDGESLIGSEVLVEVDRLLQTEAGRMIFATILTDDTVVVKND